MLLYIGKNGHYRILRHIGIGTRSDVYLAEDEITTRLVALKLLRATASTLQQEVQYPSEYEIQALMQINHPGISPVLDYGQAVIDGISVLFLVMPFFPEGSLHSWLQHVQNSRSLSLQDAACILQQGADALQYAHNSGFIHQHVRAAHFLLSSKESFRSLVLSGFQIGNIGTHPLQPELLDINTATYLAPEQWQGRPVPATDQYALAAMMYLLLTGRPPFQGNTAQLKDLHITMQPAPPSIINPILSQGVDTILLRALEKRPEDRFMHISAFSSAFQQAIQPLASPAMITPVPTIPLPPLD